MENKIKAEIISHSKRRNTGEEIITYKLTFPRIILSEVNTYKMMEKNTSSSRAIPFEKIVEVVEKEPFIPIAWQLQHRGMQGNEYITNPYVIEKKKGYWLDARDKAITAASDLVRSEIKGTHYEQNEDGSFKGKSVTLISNSTVTKQLANRLLEPFMWTTQLITGTRESFEHLFEQRCPIYDILGISVKYKSRKEAIKNHNYLAGLTDIEWLKCNKGQAEIHFMDLAEKMYDALNESKSTSYINSLSEFYDNFWHIPFEEEIKEMFSKNISTEDIIKMSVCLTAKISYTKIGDENSITIEKAREMYEKLKDAGHWSCFGHIAKCMTDEERDTWIKGRVVEDSCENGYFFEAPEETKGFCKNLRGFISLRQYIEDGVELKNV